MRFYQLTGAAIVLLWRYSAFIAAHAALSYLGLPLCEKLRATFEQGSIGIFISQLDCADQTDLKAWTELKQITTAFLEHAEWKPTATEYVAGALLYTLYDFSKGWVMKMIGKSKNQDLDTAQDCVFTDWKQLSIFLDEFFEEMKNQQMRTSAEDEYL